MGARPYKKHYHGNNIFALLVTFQHCFIRTEVNLSILTSEKEAILANVNNVVHFIKNKTILIQDLKNIIKGVLHAANFVFFS